MGAGRGAEAPLFHGCVSGVFMQVLLWPRKTGFSQPAEPRSLGIEWDLEVNHQSGRDAHVVLRNVEQVGVDVISLNAQGEQAKQLGGTTGRGFLLGRSGNPKGRPHPRGLVSELHAKLSEVGPDGRSIERQLVDVLLHDAGGRERTTRVG